VRTLAALQDALRAGAVSAESLVREALAAIDAPDRQGRVAFVSVDREGALRDAQAADALRRAGRAPRALEGMVLSIKDLFDVAGQVTTAGSRVLADAPPAAHDATAVARLRAAGAIFVGRTNMTEFAFSGIGLNPHFGTPRCAWGRGEARIAGGSSSGAAVSVAEGMAHGALGTDTGGSLRIPAAFCGLVAFKPTAARVPREGAYPLSWSIDSVGPIARTVDCCARLDAVLADAPLAETRMPLQGMRLAVPTGVMTEGLDEEVGDAFERALARLAAAGASIEHVRSAAIQGAHRSGVQGVVACAEAWALHRAQVLTRGGEYDPRVARRVRAGADIAGSDYVAAVQLRAALCAAWAEEAARFDAYVAPTVTCVPPPLAMLEHSARQDYAADLRVLRNTSIVNALDGCALSLPCHAPGEPPVGLMAFAPASRDRALLAVGRALEAEVVPTACSDARAIP
jgi:aspartyl-tRNA(Asn)/glutamyl-tRNA(Gln) amidotransferase subunit A